LAGKNAVISAINGSTDVMIGFTRNDENGQYKCLTNEIPFM
jgi:hypothetical protein